MISLELISHQPGRKVRYKQQKKMMHISNATHPPIEVENNVIIQIRYVDRAKIDFLKVIAIVWKRMDYLHKIGPKDSELENCIAG